MVGLDLAEKGCAVSQDLLHLLLQGLVAESEVFKLQPLKLGECCWCGCGCGFPLRGSVRFHVLPPIGF